MPVIVHFHGNNGEAGDSARVMQPVVALGYGVVAAEYRGYSGNAGTPDEAGLIQDGLAQIAWAKARWPGAPLVLWGESLGTGVAVAVAGSTQPLALVLDSPFTSIREIAQGLMPFAPVSLLLRSPFESLARLRVLMVPTLVLVGESDTVVPPAMGRQMIAALRCPRSQGVLLPGVGHLAIRSDASGRALAAVVAFLGEVRLQASGGC